MPKINALPPMTAPDGDDVLAADDVSTTNKDTKKLSLTGLKEWLQGLAGWITTAMLGDSQINASKIDWSTSGEIWWEELGRTTLGSAGDAVTVSSFTAKKYLRISFVLIPSGSINSRVTFNNDTGSNYSQQFSTDNGAATDLVSQAFIELEGGSGTRLIFGTIDVLNISTQEKLGVNHTINQNTAGAATAPDSFINYLKWANTTNQITRVDFLNAGSGSTGDFAAGSEVVVLGHD